ncbi:MAG TPA: 16S rRNA (cytosine(967)-C(5))-methyltransferase RsmB [Verrucomicrobiae bacterium]|nr:16S rRNA (cytosine(967)-C(5))-methyltransferase RsmB [Verrucomicrobiae bacterium]
MTPLNVFNPQKPRQIAARVLGQRRTNGLFVEDLLEIALANAPLSSADRGLCQEIVYGVVRWQAALDWLILRKTTGREQKPALQNLLRLGLYQIFWLDRIPDHAAVHETVELAKQGGFGPQAGFINAVLRGYLREADETKKLLADLKISQPALGWSQPEWLVARWQKRWGADKTAQLLEWNNTPPKTFARINTLKFRSSRREEAQASDSHPPSRITHTNRQSLLASAATTELRDAGELLTLWREENVEYDFKTCDWTGENLVFELKAHPPLHSLGSFRNGWFYIQDPSTLLAVSELDPQPGETVLDLCAAPGGKTTFIAQLMNNEGRLVAQDVSEDRLKLIRENCTRLGVRCVEAVLPSTLNSQLSTTFDRILVDAPCSNSGVMRRRLDLRWRIQPDEIERLRATQLDLLGQAATRLKPGGVLVYSTCSLEPEENSEVVNAFLREHARFKLESERELLPFADNVDGAYVARLLMV